MSTPPAQTTGQLAAALLKAEKQRERDGQRGPISWFEVETIIDSVAPVRPGKATAKKALPFGDPKKIPPAPEWVEAYSKSIGYPMKGQAWCDSYETKGWTVGKSRMKNWQCAVRNWKANQWGQGGIAISSPAAAAPRDYTKFGGA